MPAKPSAAGTIVKAGLVAGTLDITAAIIVSFIKGYSYILIFRYIASAVFGKASSTGGGMVVAGLLFHYLIAFIWAAVFFYAGYPYVRSLIKSPVVAGLLYGIVVWCLMNVVIVPLTRIKQAPFNWQGVTREMAILMFCVGLPIAIITYRSFMLKTNTTD